MIQTIPVPPVPPTAPIPQGILIPDGPPAGAMIAVVVIVAVIVAGFVFWPLVRAYARRIEGKSLDPGLVNEIGQLRARVAELEESNHRLQELEERVDFSERLLAQGREALPANRKEAN